ncbi:MAG: TIGR03905 family TSCPD domain-containing protein [Treponema sp.]|jgi:uncharacterized protein (TIGR03905 family)|nr:TIGR03905 family TSCPD domain-containing protein [Treponema sp.]
MRITYRPKGICPSLIEFDITDGIVREIFFTGGCEGNLRAVSALVDGKPVAEIVRMLKGIPCGRKKTSCPDQLALALENALGANKTD